MAPLACGALRRRLVEAGPGLAGPDQGDADIVEFTRQLLRQHRVEDGLFKKLHARFGNDQLVQLTTAIGYYSLLAMTVNACELEAAPNAEVLKV